MVIHFNLSPMDYMHIDFGGYEIPKLYEIIDSEQIEGFLAEMKVRVDHLNLSTNQTTALSVREIRKKIIDLYNQGDNAEAFDHIVSIDGNNRYFEGYECHNILIMLNAWRKAHREN
jgi:hypothetical protein